MVQIKILSEKKNSIYHTIVAAYTYNQPYLKGVLYINTFSYWYEEKEFKIETAELSSEEVGALKGFLKYFGEGV